MWLLRLCVCVFVRERDIKTEKSKKESDKERGGDYADVSAVTSPPQIPRVEPPAVAPTCHKSCSDIEALLQMNTNHYVLSHVFFIRS